MAVLSTFGREKIAQQNVFHFAGAIRKTVGLSYKPGGRK